MELNVFAVDCFKRLIIIFLCLLSYHAVAAPSAKLDAFWQKSNEQNAKSIDHSLWQQVLNRNLVRDHPSGIYRFDYKGIKPSDRALLEQYIDRQTAIDPRVYNQAEQKAYWINLYNALTVDLVIQHYPVKSITKIRDGLFGFGPWDDVVTDIAGRSLTLNDIEHRILRPIWRDNRIHYAVNCASLSCPNLLGTAYTAANTEQLLEGAAKDYVNHRRAVAFKDGELWLSSIYKWYIEDFGDSEANLMRHLGQYADSKLKERLRQFRGDIEYHYDWDLNQP